MKNENEMILEQNVSMRDKASFNLPHWLIFIFIFFTYWRRYTYNHHPYLSVLISEYNSITGSNTY